jgi:RHS repeat-associated protein
MTQPIQQNSTRQHTVLLAVDFKNSVLAEIDAGNPNRIAYTPYGQQSAQLDVMSGAGFNGELREAEPEWYLLGKGYRAYNPRLMRFHSPDSWSPFWRGGLNAYMYCGGEPVMRSDPTGHSFGVFALGFRLSVRLRAAVSEAATLAVNAVSDTASAISRGASQVADVLSSSRKALSDAVSFKDFPTPPPRKTKPPTTSRAYSRVNTNRRTNAVRTQQAEMMDSRFGGISRNTGATRPTSPAQRNSTSRSDFNWNEPDSIGNAPPRREVPDNFTEVFHMRTGTAHVIRRGR